MFEEFEDETNGNRQERGDCNAPTKSNRPRWVRVRAVVRSAHRYQVVNRDDLDVTIT